MDIFAKYASFANRHEQLLGLGVDPFAVRLDELHSATEADIGGRRTILAGTNNYLGLTYDPDCIAAAEAALTRYGTGTTGSRIANGTYGLHTDLEAEFARMLDRRSCMVFSTGYQANLAMIAGLAGARDVVLIDADSHASIYDACKLAGATIVRFRHNDAADLDRRLTRLGPEGDCKLVIVEGMYSMLGDTAPLPEFVRLLRRAWPGLGRAAGRRAGRRFRGRHVQQEPGRHRRLRRLRPPAVQPAASVCAALHVHGLAQPGEHGLGAGGAAPDRAGPGPARAALGQRAPSA
jgi:Aminotransferase class I and II